MVKASSEPKRTAIAIMAAGKGTRLKSKLPKVLHEVGGRPQLAHVIAAAAQVVAKKDIYVIIGHEAEKVREALANTGVGFIVQAPQRGTGHALMVARKELERYDQIIVLSGDAPLITPATIRNMDDFHRKQKAAMTILTAEVENPFGYGRIIRKSAKSLKSKPSSSKRPLVHHKKSYAKSTPAFTPSTAKRFMETLTSSATTTPIASIT